MRLWVSNPEIVRIEYRRDCTDPEAEICSWARFDFDTNECALFVSSDCGSWAYSLWDIHDMPFIEFMSVVNMHFFSVRMFRENINHLGIAEKQILNIYKEHIQPELHRLICDKKLE